MVELQTAAGVRAALGITHRQLEYLLLCRPDLEPDRIAGRRVYTAEDMERLRAALALRRAARSAEGASQ